jgi:hypothetical protein
VFGALGENPTVSNFGFEREADTDPTFRKRRRVDGYDSSSCAASTLSACE